MSATRQRVAIVTGAGSGIGLEVARQLSALGWSLVLSGRTRSKLDAVGASLSGAWVAIEGDVGDQEYVRSLVTRAVARFGGVDALVSAAGAVSLGTIAEHTPEMIRECFATNSVGPAMLMAAVWPSLRLRGGGCIVNISSMASIDPYDGFFAYAASKSALNMLSKVGDRQGQRDGIRCYCVAPGAVETPMLRSLFSRQQVPASATVSAGDVASVVVGCVSGERAPNGGEPIVVRR